MAEIQILSAANGYPAYHLGTAGSGAGLVAGGLRICRQINSQTLVENLMGDIFLFDY